VTKRRKKPKQPKRARNVIRAVARNSGEPLETIVTVKGGHRINRTVTPTMRKVLEQQAKRKEAEAS